MGNRTTTGAVVGVLCAVLAGTVSDEAWAALEQRKGERWMVEYAIFTLFLQLTMRLQQVVVQKLERDRRPELQVCRRNDDAHAASAQRAVDPVLASDYGAGVVHG